MHLYLCVIVEVELPLTLSQNTIPPVPFQLVQALCSKTQARREGEGERGRERRKGVGGARHRQGERGRERRKGVGGKRRGDRNGEGKARRGKGRGEEI